jgi:glycerol-3-phosphate dehydrogenase
MSEQLDEPGRRTTAEDRSKLSPENRERALAAMASDELDVLVIGGGVVGAGAALDAASRGLITGLVEARDWASGTSSRSSKLIHGGLRYLEMLDFGLVHEALHERGLLLQRLAPHLVKPVSFLYPLRHRVWERAYVGAGVLLYDTMAMSSGTSRGLPVHRHLGKRRALREAPAFKPSALVGAVQYWDAQVDDARHTMTVARTAAARGALCANRTSVVGFVKDGDRVVGATLVDLETERRFVVRAKQVINATGVWTDDTQALADTRPQINVRASKGIHLLVPRDRIASSTGLILRTEKSVLFVIPWHNHWIIGTTDTDWNLDKSHPAASAADIEYLLGHVNSVLATPLVRDDIVGVYAGLRPLLSGESESTSKLSREHVVSRPCPGLVVVAGGKYTTYRVMARDAVDEAVRELGRSVPPSSTETIPLLGAADYAALVERRHALAAAAGCSPAIIERLLGRYGSLVHDIIGLIRDQTSLASPLAGAPDYLRAEIVYAASHEGARHLDDVLARRTHISIETRDRGLTCARAAAELMAGPLGWSAEQIDTEVGHYEMRVRAELDSQQQADDATAEAVRTRAPEIVPLT